MAVMRRPDGALEDDILRVLWQADEPLLPAEILERSGLSLAYTSVATVLTRLVEKGIVERQPAGRAFRYRAALSERQLAGQRIEAILTHANDREGALAGFVDKLSKRDTALLRKLLKNQ